MVPGLLDGLGNVWRLVAKQLMHPHRGPASLGAVASATDPIAAADPVLGSPARART